MKITVRNPVQHDGVTYSQGRHDVSDEIGKALISNGSATDGWTEDEGPLSEAGTQNPPGRAAPAPTAAPAPAPATGRRGT